MATIVTARAPSRRAARRDEHKAKIAEASARVREADQTDDIIQQYEARQQLKPLVDAVGEKELSVWLDKNRDAYEVARLHIAWKALPGRLLHRAVEADRDVVRFRDAITEALESGGDALQKIAGYGGDAITGAARASIARAYAEVAQSLYNQGLSAEEGFRKFEEYLTSQALNEARFQRFNSSSHLHNVTGEAKRLQLMDLLERMPLLKSRLSLV